LLFIRSLLMVAWVTVYSAPARPGKAPPPRAAAEKLPLLFVTPPARGNNGENTGCLLGKETPS